MLKQYSNKELMQIIGERARNYRLNLAISQEDMANIAGMSLSTIQKFESGKANISLNNFLTILRHLGILENVDALLPVQRINPYRSK